MITERKLFNILSIIEGASFTISIIETRMIFVVLISKSQRKAN